MSVNAQPGTICNNIEQILRDVAGRATGNTKRSKTGFLDALRSPLNNNGLQRIMASQGNGQKRKVDLRYLQRVTQSEIAQTESATCTTTNERGYFEDEADITLYSMWEEKIQECYIMELCEGKTAYFENLMRTAFDAIARDMNAQLIDAAALSFGTNIATGLSTARTVRLLDAGNDEAVLKVGTAQFLHTDIMQDNEFWAAPIVVGQGVFSRFNLYRQMGCCNDQGADMAELTSLLGYSYFYDQQMDTQLGADECIVFEPGALKLLNYTRNQGTYDIVRSNTGAYGAFVDASGKQKGSIVDPATGIIYDIYLDPDHCVDEWYIRIDKRYDVYALPTDMYSNTDHLDGSNGLLNYLFTST
jgi:hypothetical protein